MSWQNGRELASFEQNGSSVSYTYDLSGLRTSKTVTNSSGATTEYTYVYEDGQLVQMTRGSRVLDFIYDANGNPICIAYRSRATSTPTYYYYAVNSRGDVIALYNSNGTMAAKYEYDAYGKLLSVETASGIAITGETSVAIMNPLRYRGYVYDNETGLYYNSTRYYDPTICRFVNADTTEVLTATLSAHNDKNLFAYCDNNPVSRADDDGECWNVIIGAAVGAVVGVAGQFVSDLITSSLAGEWTFSNWQTYTGAFLGGAVGGAILGGTGNVAAANMASGVVTTGVGLTLEKVTGVSDKSWVEIGVNTVADGAISYGLGKLPGVNNITKGRNNMNAIYRSGLTKLRNNTAKRLSAKVIAKGVTSSFVGSLAMDAYYGVKQFAYDRIRDRI